MSPEETIVLIMTTMCFCAPSKPPLPSGQNLTMSSIWPLIHGARSLKKNKKFLAVLGLCCSGWAFSSCSVQAARCGGLSCCGAQSLGHMSFSSCDVWAQQLWLEAFRGQVMSCGSWAQLPRGLWDLPRPGMEPVSLALQGEFSTTGPPGKPIWCSLYNKRLVKLPFIYFTGVCAHMFHTK